MESQNNKIKSFILFCVALLFAYYFLLLTGCSTPKRINYHNKQAARHTEKAIKLGYQPKADTVFKEIPIITPLVRIDTIIKEIKGDTIKIEKERLKLKYVRFMDSVFIEAECLADTIIKRVPYSVQEKIYIEKSFYDLVGLNTWWKIALFWLVVVLIGILLLWRLIK